MPPRRHDQLATAWNAIAQAGRSGPLDERTCRLLELAIAIGARDKEAVRAAHQRAVQFATFGEEIDQLVTLAAATIGRAATLATYTWLGIDDPGAASITPTTPDAKPSDA